MSKISNALGRVYQNLASAKPGPSADFQAARKVAPGVLKVVAALTNFSTEAAIAEQQLSEVVATQTNGKGRLVPGSFNRRGRLAVAVVTANAVSKPIDASFTMVTASQALAADGQLWSVIDQGGSKRVVLEGGDDLEGIFAARVASRAVHASYHEGAGLVTASVNNGDLVRYVDSASQTAQWGLAFHTTAGLQVVGSDLNRHVVADDLIVASTPRSKLPKEIASCLSGYEVTAKLSPEKFDKIRDYLAKAYGPASGPMLERLSKLASVSN